MAGAGEGKATRKLCKTQSEAGGSLGIAPAYRVRGSCPERYPDEMIVYIMVSNETLDKIVPEQFYSKGKGIERGI